MGGGAVACQLIAGLEEREVQPPRDAATPIDTLPPLDVAAEAACETCGTASCVDPTTDPNNCGFCGHSCGGACTGGLCPVLDVYGGFTNGAALAIDDANLYVAERQGVWAVRKTDNVVQKIVSGFFPQGVTTAAGRVYVSQPFQIVRVLPDGGQLQVLFARDAGGSVPINGDLAADPPWTFWTTQSGLLGVSEDGGPVVDVLPEDASVDGSLGPSSLGVNASNVYYLRGYDLVRAARDGTTRDKIGSSLTGGTRLALTSDSVVWGDGATIRRTGFDGGATLIATSSGTSDVAVYKGRIYWSEVGTGTQTGAIMTIPLAGGTPSPLATKLSAPGRIAVDDGYVYWLENLSSGSLPSPVRKVAR